MARSQKYRILFFGTDKKHALTVGRLLDADVVTYDDPDAALLTMLVTPFELVLCDADPFNASAMLEFIQGVKSICPTRMSSLVAHTGPISASVERALCLHGVRTIPKSSGLAGLRAVLPAKAA